MIKPSAQICAAHHELLSALVLAHSSPDEPEILSTYAEDGWGLLVAALRAWRAGQPVDLARLDEEDQMIFSGVQYALTHPEWLQTLPGDAREEAASAIAQMIFSATWGDHDALDLLSSMREAAADLGQDGSTAHAFVCIVEGARRVSEITVACPQADIALVVAVIEQLTRLEQDDAPEVPHSAS